MRKFIPIGCAMVLVFAQVVNITMSVGGKTVTLQKLPKSTITFDMPSTPADPSGNATFAVGQTTTRQPPAGLQFDLVYTPADVTSVSVVAGAAAQAAGKSVQCASPIAGTTRCIVAGLNQMLIGPGPVAQVTVQVARNTTFQLSNLIASSAEGTALTTVATSGGGNVTMALAVLSLTCIAPSYDQGLPAGQYKIEPGETLSCSATLNQAAPTGDFTVPVTMSQTGVTAPANLTIPAGQNSVSFTITGS